MIPKDCRFPGRKDGECVEVFLRKHWILDVKIGLIFMILALIPLVVYVIAVVGFWPTEILVGHLIALLVFIVYFMFAFLVTFIKWLNEELDVVLVTNKRVIGHDQVDFFHKEVSETSLTQIQDVRGVEKGFLGSVFHYGEIVIQTAGEKAIFEIKNVARPYDSARQILEIRDNYLARHNS